jgi:hypothetical protein
MLGIALASVDPDEPDPFARIEPYFDLVMDVAGAVIDATDAYMFDMRRLRSSTKKRLDACRSLFEELKAQTPGASGHPELAWTATR